MAARDALPSVDVHESGAGSSTESSDSGSSSSGEVAKLEVPRRGNPAWHFTVVTSAFTLGIVFAPYTLAGAGWGLGTLWWVYSYGTTWWSGVLIGKCVIDGTSRGVGSSYPEIAEDLFGFKGYVFAAVAQIATYYLVNVTLMVNAADWFLMAQDVVLAKARLDPSSGLCLWEYIWIVTAVSVVFAQIPTFKRFLPLAVFSLLCTVGRLVVLVYQVEAADVLSDCEPRFEGTTVQSAFTALAVTAFLFGGHGLFPEEMRELARQESFFQAFHWSYVIIGAMYAAFTYLAYAAWGNWVYGDIQFNWPLNTATLISVLLSAGWGLVEMACSHVVMLSLVETQLGIGKRRRGHLPPTVQRVLLRGAFAISEGFFAFMFSAAGIANIQGMVGAFGFSALTYYAPFAMYWRLRVRQGHCPVWLQAALCLAFLSGIFVTITGVYSSGVGIYDEIGTYSFFDRTRCQASHVVNLNSCDNPCLEAYGFSPSTCDAGS